MKENSREEDINRCNKLTETTNANWIGISNQLAIKHILSDYKRVLKESEELEEKTTILLAGAEKVKQLEKENEELNLKYHMLYTEKIDKQKAQEVKIKSQVIPIQKVKDKIEELEAQYKIALEENSTKAFILKCQITILQELLEGRK